MRYIVPLLTFVLFLSCTAVDNTHASPRLSPFQKGAEARFDVSENNTYRKNSVRSYYPRRNTSTYLTTRQQRMPKNSLRFSSSNKIRGQRKRSTNPVKKLIVPLQITRTKFETQRASDIPFYFAIPEGFTKGSDNLTWRGGSLKFTNEKSTIEVFSTGTQCDGGSTYERNCFLAKAKELNEKIKTNHPKTKVKEDKSTYQQQSNVMPNTNNLARSLILENDAEKVYQFIFTDPTNGFIWGLKVLTENLDEVVLSKESNVRRIISSLFKKGPTERKVSRRSQLTEKTEKNVFNYSQITSKRPVIKKLDNNDTFNAKGIPFQIKLPKGFEMKRDSLGYDNGEMYFEMTSESGGNILISSSGEKCDFDTSALVRRCIEKASKEQSDILWFETPGVQFLHEDNILFKPTFSQKTKNVGRIFLARENKKRIGIFTFAEPKHNNIWTIEMYTADTKNSFINDMREIRKIVTSMYFKKK